MHSNGPGMQPKSLQETQHQFDSLLQALDIPLSLSSKDKLARLRATTPARLIAASVGIPIHEFRAVTDGSFVRKTLFSDIDSGLYAQRLRDAGVELLLGECRDENFLYGSYRPPAADSREAMHKRLLADYPAAAVDAIMPIYSPDGGLPKWKPCKDWQRDAHGYIFADVQVHALQRGFVQRLIEGGAAECVKRYRMEWRAGCCDSDFPKEWGVTHGTDMAVWFWGNGMGGKGLTRAEKEAVEQFARPFWKFLRGEMRDDDWGTKSPKESRRFRSDGKVDIWEDQDWDRGVGVYDAVRKAQQSDVPNKNAKL